RPFAAAAASSELLGGLLVVLGLLGPIGPALIVSVMIVAALSVHWGHGVFAASNGIEVPLLYGAGAAALALTGPGRYSFDAALGLGNTTEFDPFLLFDDFRNENPNDYLAGFPWHPHRGIETITYVLAGTVDHGDSLGNRGSLGAGDVQWMTAGSGILHQEMPKGDAHGRMHGFQLWANLPASLKMTKPRYQDVVANDIPEVVDDDGTRVRVICGDFWGKK